MLDQETDNTETWKQIDISVASSSKYQDKAKKPNQGLKRHLQIEWEEINEAETHEELEEVVGQSDPLNLNFGYFDSRFQEIQNQNRKIKDKEPAEKNRQVEVATFKQIGHRLQREFNIDIMEDFQDIIDNISDEQDPVSTSLKAVISKLKNRKRLIKTADSAEGGWSVAAEYERSQLEATQMIVREYDKQAKRRALKKKNTEKLKSNAFKPTSTLRNSQIGQQFWNANFRHDYSPTSSSSRQYSFECWYN